MIDTLRVFVGFDPRQPIAAHTMAASIARHASRPVAITYLRLEQLAPFGRKGLTEFTYSRFLVPYLCSYEGVGVFVDSDMIVTGDIAELVDPIVSDLSVYVRKDLPKHLSFEMAAVMVFDNPRCLTLTPDYVQNAPTGDLFGLRWAVGGIGGIPKEWGHLVGYENADTTPKLLHFTQGVPIFAETEKSPYRDEWIAEHRKMNSTVPWADLMGNSVHAVAGPDGKPIPKLAAEAA